MKPSDQILILKALAAIELLAKNTSIDVLLNPEYTLAKSIANISKLKYKLSIIDGIFSKYEK